MTGDHNERTETTAESTRDGHGISRKTLLKAAMVAIPVPIVLAAAPAFSNGKTPSGQPLVATAACDDGDDTPAQTEGPYFKPGSPLRTSIVDGPGTALTVSGYVFGLSCQPISGALLDFWQADNGGDYDNTTYRFRGHQFSDANGMFTLTTVVPGLYPGRTRHIHVKVQAPNNPILTSQLYFPNEPRNATDYLYNPDLEMTVQSNGSGRVGTFDFVLNVTQDPDPTATPTSTPTGSPGGTWQAGVSYQVGDQVTYSGITYVCQIAHTSMTGWEPPNTPALWRRV